MREPSPEPAGDEGSGSSGDDGSGRSSQSQSGHDAQRVRELYAQAEATRMRSALLAEQLEATHRRASENWQLVQEAWYRMQQIRAHRVESPADPDRLRYPASARLQARLDSMPVIEQAKGIIMVQYGWTEDQAFAALRQVSQQENVKIGDLAMNIVAGAARPADGSSAYGSLSDGSSVDGSSADGRSVRAPRAS